MSEPAPATIAHYEIERILGRGTMGVVYLARDRRIRRQVALKKIAVRPELLDDTTTTPNEFYMRLQREAEVCGSLVHPNIVALYEAGYEQNRISYLAMEYVDGETLLAMMNAAAPRRLPLETSLRIIGDVLRGLAYAHGRGIVHRDIKPANILVGRDGAAKITDFGIARPQNSSLTRAGSLLGTPNYMSPEQVVGSPPTPKTDIFSTGVLLFEMLTGVKPFAAADLTGVLHNILRQPVPHASDLNPAVPRAIGDVVARMTAKKPEERPDANGALGGLTLRVERRPPPDVARRPRAAAAPLALGGLAILLIIVLSLMHTTSTKPAAAAPAPVQTTSQQTQTTATADQPKPPAKTARHRRRSKDISASEMLRRIKKVFRH